jgi:hypothetical protein
MIERQRRRNFKKCRVRIPIGDLLADRMQAIRHFLFFNHFPVHADALAIAHQVRGGKQPGAIPLGAADRINHGADRAFSIRPGDVNDALILPRKL